MSPVFVRIFLLDGCPLWLIAHEFGHILGFDDAYRDVPGKGSVIIPGHENDIMDDHFNNPKWQHAKILGEQYAK